MSKTRKSGRGRRRNGSSMRGLTNTKGVLPDRSSITHTFSSYYVFAPAAGASTIYSFRGNSVWDPDFTGAGGVSTLFNTYASLYNRHRVLSSRISLQFTNLGTAPMTAYLMATILNSPPTALAIWSQRHIATGTCAPGGPICWKHTASAGTAAIFGVPKVQVLSEDDFAAIGGSVPNNVWYWHVLMFNPSAVAGSCSLQLRIEYPTVWSMSLALA